MAALGSFGSVGGYSTAFLMADQLERFSAVKIKLYGNKAVDLEDLEKHGMHSVVEALQRLKWIGICTVSKPSYPHLAKAFYTCLKTEEDGSLTSMVKKNVWSKTSVAEGEAIIGEAFDAPPVQEEEATVREDEPPASERRIEDIALELIEPVGQSAEGVIPPLVPAPTIIEESVIGGGAHTEGEHEDIQIEESPSIPVVETAMEESHEVMIPEVVSPGHIEDVQIEDALAQGEPEAEGEQDIQEEPTVSALADQFQEGLLEDTSDEDDEPAVGSGAKGKGVAT
ncbi:hypothetical protein Taro_041909 [Colocasia esculenta]|uniref:Uncharacterized protein n=1 Tax=Colocasia esculenta TaxID=4460 RepID=A0A843WMM8_COLES|nr:hypothetical protein [Colocasia esculenta]